MAGLLPWHKAKQLDKIGERGDVRALQRLLDEDTRTSLTSIESRRAFRTLALTAAVSGHTAMVRHLCEERNVAVHTSYEQSSPDALVHMPLNAQRIFCSASPLVGAIGGKHEDLALYLLALPDQNLDLQMPMDAGCTVLHYTCSMGLSRVVQALLARGAELEACDDDGRVPLCIAAKACDIPIAGCLLERYRDLGPAKLQEVLSQPCHPNGLPMPLLAFVARGEIPRRDSASPSAEAQVSMLRYLVREWKANVWQRFGYDGSGGFLCLNVAAMQGCIPALDFYITECEMPVDTLTGGFKLSPLQMVCKIDELKEAQILLVVKWLVETKHADKGLRDSEGRTAADMALQSGMQRVAAYLSSSEREAKAKMAEEELLSMLNADEVALSNKRQKKQKKKTGKKKQDSTERVEGSGEEIARHGEEMKKCSGAHVPDSQEVGDTNLEGGPREGNQAEHQHKRKPGVSGITAVLTSEMEGLTINGAKSEEDEVDKERAFLLQNAPEEFVCPLTHELLTDPVVAACGYSYQRTAFEEWVAQCRAKGLQLTSPETGAPMESHMFINRLLKQQVEEYKEARLQAWRRQREESRAGGGATEEGGGKEGGESKCG